MSIFVGSQTRLLVQGTGRQGSFHAGQMIDYGTRVVGGVSRGKGPGEWLNLPRLETVREGVERYEANASVIFVPAAAAADAVCEAADAGIRTIVCITEGIPPKDMLWALQFVERCGSTLIGPNCPGVISPGKSKVGIMPGFIHRSGRVGVVSRSGTLTYEAVDQLSKLGIGQSTCVGIGGDPLSGSSFVDVLKRFQKDEGTDAVVLIGEIGGSAEQEAAHFIEHDMTKPVLAFIAGATAPPGRRMGHAGAIVEGPDATAAAKKQALSSAGARVVDSPAEIGKGMLRVLREEGLLRGNEGSSEWPIG